VHYWHRCCHGDKDRYSHFIGGKSGGGGRFQRNEDSFCDKNKKKDANDKYDVKLPHVLMM